MLIALINSKQETMRWHLILFFETRRRIVISEWENLKSDKRTFGTYTVADSTGALLISPWPFPFPCVCMLTLWEQPSPLADRSCWMKTPLPHPSHRTTLWPMVYVISQWERPQWDWAPAAHNANQPGNTPLAGSLLFLYHSALWVLPEIASLRDYIQSLASGSASGRT